MVLSERILRNDCTIFISKEKRSKELKGEYLKNINSGVCPYEISQKEVILIKHLPEIMKQLDDGALLQLRMNNGQINAIIGNKKTDELYCSREYLEVVVEIEKLNYYDALIDLNAELFDNRRKEIKERKKEKQKVKKIYKGVSSYE